jgi:hypothetical protein
MLYPFRVLLAPPGKKPAAEVRSVDWSDGRPKAAHRSAKLTRCPRQGSCCTASAPHLQRIDFDFESFCLGCGTDVRIASKFSAER